MVEIVDNLIMVDLIWYTQWLNVVERAMTNACQGLMVWYASTEVWAKIQAPPGLKLWVKRHKFSINLKPGLHVSHLSLQVFWVVACTQDYPGLEPRAARIPNKSMLSKPAFPKAHHCQSITPPLTPVVSFVKTNTCSNFQHLLPSQQKSIRWVWSNWSIWSVKIHPSQN